MRAVAQEGRAGGGRGGRLAAVKGFFRDAWLELQRVIWPTQENVVKMTGFVIAVVVVVGLFMFLWGSVLSVLTGHLF